MIKPKRIALFGGTFDPVHHGHVSMAVTAQRALELDEVCFIPCQISPHKSAKPTPAHERLEMLRRAVVSIPWASIDSYELERAGPSYSIDTAEHYAALHPKAQLFWILGTDQWAALPRWHRWQDLSRLVEFIVFSREGAPVEPRPAARTHAFQDIHPAAATEIRQRIGSHQEVPTNWLDPAVAEYIKTHQLYR